MGQYSHLIMPGAASPLSGVPFHKDTDAVQRIAWPGFPVHIAMHYIEGVADMPERYVLPHCHEHPEINVMASETELEYEIMLGDEVYTVKAPCAVWIPEGLSHATNVISGSGHFVCVLLGGGYEAKGA